jgi:chromate transporter
METPTPKLATTDRPAPSRAPLLEVMWLFLRLGFTAFGGPAAHIAMMREDVVRRRQWMSEQRFVDLIGVTNLIPGPSSTELAIYLGYLRAGWPGLLIAGVCFIGPAMLIVLALAWAYVTYGALPQIDWLFYGIQPVVVAIIAQAIWNLGRTVFKGPLAIGLAVLVLATYLLGVNVLILLFGGRRCMVFCVASAQKKGRCCKTASSEPGASSAVGKPPGAGCRTRFVAARWR